LAAAGALQAAQLDAPGQQMTYSGRTLAAVNSDGVVARVEGGGGPVMIFDSFTGAGTLTTTTGSPRTFMGDPFTTTTGTGTTVTIQEATVYLASTAAQSFSNGVQIRVQFWETYASGATPVFATAGGGVQTFTLPGPVNLALNTFTPINLVFPTPIVLSGLENGISINYQGDNGAGFASSDTITSLIRGNGALAVGSNTPNGAGFVAPTFGFYRNAAAQTTFNFAPSDFRQFAGITDILLALQLRGSVSPVELQHFEIK
jgi:hypothetical protein